MVGLQKVGGIGILFQDGFNLCIVHSIILSMVFTETRSSIIITAVAHIVKVQRIVILELAVAPCTAGKEVIRMPGVIGPPKTIQVAETVVATILNHHLYPVGNLIVSRQPFLIPKGQPVRRYNIHRIADTCNFHFSGRILHDPGGKPAGSAHLHTGEDT